MFFPCAELYNTSDETRNKKRKEMLSPCAELSKTKVLKERHYQQKVILLAIKDFVQS